MCISFATVLQDKCQSVLTEGAVWANALAGAPAIIHASKEPDGEVRVSVKILFLDGGVRSCFYIRAPSDYVLASLNHSLLQPPQLSLKPSFCCYYFFFFSIRSGHMGPLIKTNRAHQEGAPEDQSGQSLLIYRRPDQTYHILSGRSRDNVRLLFAKSEFSSLRKKKKRRQRRP